MELDQRAYKHKKEIDSRFKGGVRVRDLILWAWRRNQLLEDWMVGRYREKGGEGEFSGNTLELTKEDLHRLKNERVPGTDGFVKKGLAALSEGYGISYRSWS